MRTFSKLALAASISLALALTFTACSDLFGDDSSSGDEAVENKTFDSAFRYMKYLLKLETDSRVPFDIIYSWYGWTDYDYGDASEIFNNKIDFENCKADYEETLDENRTSSKGLNAIADYYANSMGKEKILSSSMFKRSGAKDLMNILILSHDDIYKGGKSGADIYNIMKVPLCRDYYEEYYDEEDETWYEDVYSYCDDYPYIQDYYDDLSEYMSEKTLSEIRKINGNDEDYMYDSDIHLAAWTYSFWGRRHNEGIADAVYSLLKTVENMYK